MVLSHLAPALLLLAACRFEFDAVSDAVPSTPFIWHVEQAPTTARSFHLFGVFGSGGELFACGSGSVILRSTGDGVWQAEDVGLGIQTLDVLWAATPNRIYGPSSGGLILVGTR